MATVDGSFTSDAWVFGGRQRHHRERDHFGFDEDTNVVLSAPIGPYLEGDAIHDVIEELLARLVSLESTAKYRITFTADAYLLGLGVVVMTDAGPPEVWQGIWDTNAVLQATIPASMTADAILVMPASSFTADAAFVCSFTANAVLA